MLCERETKVVSPRITTAMSDSNFQIDTKLANPNGSSTNLLSWDGELASRKDHEGGSHAEKEL